MSTGMLAINNFVYGNAIIRLPALGVTISSVDGASRIQAYGFFAATRAKFDQSRPRCSRCSGIVQPRRARRAFSKSGYTLDGKLRPCPYSAGVNGAGSSGEIIGRGTSLDCIDRKSVVKGKSVKLG